MFLRGAKQRTQLCDRIPFNDAGECSIRRLSDLYQDAELETSHARISPPPSAHLLPSRLYCTVVTLKHRIPIPLLRQDSHFPVSPRYPFVATRDTHIITTKIYHGSLPNHLSQCSHPESTSRPHPTARNLRRCDYPGNDSYNLGRSRYCGMFDLGSSRVAHLPESYEKIRGARNLANTLNAAQKDFRGIPGNGKSKVVNLKEVAGHGASVGKAYKEVARP